MASASNIQLQLLLRAEKLPKRRPNSFCIVSLVSDHGSVLGLKRQNVGITEVSRPNSSPEWSSVILLDHCLGQETLIAVDVFTTNDPNLKPTIHPNVHRGYPTPKGADLLCGLLFDVESILSQTDSISSQKIPGAGEGRIHVRAEATRSNHGDPSDVLRFQIRGVKLPNTRRNFLDRPDFRLAIRRRSLGEVQDSWDLVYLSDIIKDTLNPMWALEEISILALCNHDFTRDLRLIVLDWKPMLSGHPGQILGWAETTLQGLLDSRIEPGQGNTNTSKAMNLESERQSNKPLGSLVVVEAEVQYASDRERSSFSKRMSQAEGEVSTSLANARRSLEVVPVEIMQAPSLDFHSCIRRTELELCLGIDFHHDNGELWHDESKHFKRHGKLNDYEWIISVLGETMKEFSSRQSYPMWGTSAVFSGRQVDIFQMGSSSAAAGLEGMRQAYDITVSNSEMEMSKRARSFDNIINGAASYSMKTAKSVRSPQLSYTLLVVVTTGSDQDVMRSKDKLLKVCKSQSTPLSILFLRVDNGSRTSMSDVMLHTFLGAKGATRTPVDCFDASNLCKNRASMELAQVVIEKLQRDVPQYFLATGVY